jgi:hypothetical protein
LGESIPNIIDPQAAQENLKYKNENLDKNIWIKIFERI